MTMTKVNGKVYSDVLYKKKVLNSHRKDSNCGCNVCIFYFVLSDSDSFVCKTGSQLFVVRKACKATSILERHKSADIVVCFLNASLIKIRTKLVPNEDPPEAQNTS